MKLLLAMLIACVSHAAIAKEATHKIGEATFSFLWMDVYSSALFSDETTYNEDGFLRLENTYHMDFTSEELFDSTREELERVSNADAETIDTWMKQLEGVYPNVKEGEVIAAVRDGAQVKLFYQGDAIGTLRGDSFARAFMGIWLSEESRSPSFSRELTAR